LNLRCYNKTRDQKHLRYSLQKLMLRRQKLQMSSPFDDWAEWVKEVKGNRMVLSKAVHRIAR